MPYFTVITTKRVLRLNAKSLQHATQALNAVHIPFQSITPDSEH